MDTFKLSEPSLPFGRGLHDLLNRDDLLGRFASRGSIKLADVIGGGAAARAFLARIARRARGQRKHTALAKPQLTAAVRSHGESHSKGLGRPSAAKAKVTARPSKPQHV